MYGKKATWDHMIQLEERHSFSGAGNLEKRAKDIQHS